MHESYGDVEVGERYEFGHYEVTESEIVEFAEQYDPQPFHTDPEAAEESWFGGLVASGWHTGAMTMRLFVDHYVSESGGLGAVGVDELRWPNPVRPGQVLHVETEIAGKEPWKPGLGLVLFDIETVTDDGTVVLSMTARGVFEHDGEEG